MVGAELATKGNTEISKDLLYKALANDNNCPLALYELGKIFEAERNNSSAANFLSRAIPGLAKRVEYASQCADATRRLQTLDPYASKLTVLLTEYARNLVIIIKQYPDSFSMREAYSRSQLLRLAEIVPIEIASMIAKPPMMESLEPAPHGSVMVPVYDTTSGTAPVSVVNNILPDAERALKAAGWTTITGIWKKTAENVYEVTDGKLEAQKRIGAIRLLVLKGGTGTVHAFVRNKLGSYGTGYGASISSTGCKLFTISSYSTSNVQEPYMDRELRFPEINSKNILMVKVEDRDSVSTIEIWVNGKREVNRSGRIARDGPFVIEIQGTVTIEDPRAVGQ